MTGPKLNEKSFVAGERSGTKASAKYIRSSARKIRVVLNLIRGLPVRNADEVLQFTDREAATIVRKVLASAVANAQHNDEQDPEELYVKACYADEGPTLKRFTPRARGRAGRINKRTAHITVVVARLDDDSPRSGAGPRGQAHRRRSSPWRSLHRSRRPPRPSRAQPRTSPRPESQATPPTTSSRRVAEVVEDAARRRRSRDSWSRRPRRRRARSRPNSRRAAADDAKRSWTTREAI